MVAGVGEALVEMSAFYHSDYHVPVVKTQQPVGGLVLVALFLILCKNYRRGDERSCILFKMRHYWEILKVS